MSALTLDKEAETSEKELEPSGGAARSDQDSDADAPALGEGVEPTVAPASAEVAIHELGESLAATVASVQGEMARYNTALGTYVLDEIDISIPVMLRVTRLGQVMARVTDSQPPDAAVGQIRLRLKPSTGAAPVPTPNGAAQPLSTIDLINPYALARLAEERVFSVGDLLRVAATAAGRDALAREIFGYDPTGILDRAALISLPLPEGVSTLLIKLGVTSPEQFLRSDPTQLADTMRGYASLPVSASDISQWQEAAAAYMDAMPLYR